MDYSLLVGVKRRTFEVVDKNNAERTVEIIRDDGGFNAIMVEGQGTFYVGIIDILQEWNYTKWYERMFKIYVLRKDPLGISAIEPETYFKRFYQRAVLEVFDGLDGTDADPADLFEVGVSGRSDPVGSSNRKRLTEETNKSSISSNNNTDGSVDSLESGLCVSPIRGSTM